VAAHMTKDELREDPVLERIQSFMRFAEHNVRWFIAGAIVVVVVIVAVFALQRGQTRTAREAGQALTEGQASYLQGNYPMAESQLRQVIDQYGSTKAAGVAQIFLGHTLLDEARPEDALEAYTKATGKVGDDPELKAAVSRGRGAALRDLGRFDEASRAYEEASGIGALQRVDDLIAAGRAALRAGDAARAKELLGRVKTDEAGDRSGQIGFLMAEAEAALQ
jgi:predicted negative regulator of RcsB-dependent stress response